LPIHSSTGKVSIVVSLHDPSDFSLGLIRRLTCYPGLFTNAKNSSEIVP
jgi:hypothetical protein